MGSHLAFCLSLDAGGKKARLNIPLGFSRVLRLGPFVTFIKALGAADRFSACRKTEILQGIVVFGPD